MECVRRTSVGSRSALAVRRAGGLPSRHARRPAGSPRSARSSLAGSPGSAVAAARPRRPVCPSLERSTPTTRRRRRSTATTPPPTCNRALTWPAPGRRLVRRLRRRPCRTSTTATSWASTGAAPAARRTAAPLLPVPGRPPASATSRRGRSSPSRRSPRALVLTGAGQLDLPPGPPLTRPRRAIGFRGPHPAVPEPEVACACPRELQPDLPRRHPRAGGDARARCSPPSATPTARWAAWTSCARRKDDGDARHHGRTPATRRTASAIARGARGDRGRARGVDGRPRLPVPRRRQGRDAEPRAGREPRRPVDGLHARRRPRVHGDPPRLRAGLGLHDQGQQRDGRERRQLGRGPGRPRPRGLAARPGGQVRVPAQARRASTPSRCRWTCATRPRSPRPSRSAPRSSRAST